MTPILFSFNVDDVSANRDVTYFFNSDSRQIIRVDGTNNSGYKPVFSDVESVNFYYYNILGNPTTNITEAKMVRLVVEMTRNVLSFEHSESVSTARITMRNRTVTN